MRELSSDLETLGYAVVADIDPDASTLETADLIGSAIGAKVTGSVQCLSANPINAKPLNTYGGNFGLRALPMHTDLAHWLCPPRYVLLRCLIGTPTVRTRLLKRTDLSAVASPEQMRRALFSPRRRLEGKSYLLHMFDDELLRWDELFLKPQNVVAKEIFQRMQQVEAGLPTFDVLLSKPGCTLVIDNWNVLHGRSEVPINEGHRKIERVYLERTAHGKQDAARLV